MDFKILYSETALDDLADIMEWSWEKHPGTTERFADSLLDHVELLKIFPRMGSPVKEHPGVRSLLHSPFRIFYVVHEGRKVVEVLHFWHSARKRPKF